MLGSFAFDAHFSQRLNRGGPDVSVGTVQVGWLQTDEEEDEERRSVSLF